MLRSGSCPVDGALQTTNADACLRFFIRCPSHDDVKRPSQDMFSIWEFLFQFVAMLVTIGSGSQGSFASLSMSCKSWQISSICSTNATRRLKSFSSKRPRRKGPLLARSQIAFARFKKGSQRQQLLRRSSLEKRNIPRESSCFPARERLRRP